ncbi:hypothetical protein OEZ85_012154 [Tetradesmus obliquus]|uniref:DUF1995 domain-containing protein n=1 Tax=Tetradesmus obliquus TaxID=3088 RepID=A0ABY8TUT4_TETOB|nr:hypothetical protein OEZ85_012154 [Tetradesmus obliquus]
MVGANFWLAAGKPGQDVPGKLVSGIHRLYEQGHFLLVDPQQLATELALKEEAMATKPHVVFAAEERSLPAQQECLELFLEVLPAYYPDLYRLEGEGAARSVTITFPDGAEKSYALADFADRPLELCGRLVQEDFALLRVSDEPGPHPQEAKHVMTAASVCFSFHGLAEKLGTTTLSIHAPVPGFEEQLEKLLNRTFTALQPDKPIWRNNWAAAYTGDLTMPSYNVGGPGAQLDAMGGTRPPAEALWLKTEYQTLRRLPRSKAILFTIRTMVQPMPEIGGEAARVLHKSLSGMTPSLREYKGVPGEAADELLLLLEGIMAAEAEKGVVAAEGAAAAAAPVSAR